MDEYTMPKGEWVQLKEDSGIEQKTIVASLFSKLTEETKQVICAIIHTPTELSELFFGGNITSNKIDRYLKLLYNYNVQSDEVECRAWKKYQNTKQELTKQYIESECLEWEKYIKQEQQILTMYTDEEKQELKLQNAYDIYEKVDEELLINYEKQEQKAWGNYKLTWTMHSKAKKYLQGHRTTSVKKRRRVLNELINFVKEIATKGYGSRHTTTVKSHKQRDRFETECMKTQDCIEQLYGIWGCTGERKEEVNVNAN